MLAEVGSVLADSDLPSVEVRLPRELAEKAVAAWKREETRTPPTAETFEQRMRRHRAGTLALIGLSIAEGGRWDGDEMVVPLSADLIGVAVDASDDLPPQS